MAVNLRKKYYGSKEVSKKNRTYRYQLDFYHGKCNDWVGQLLI